MEERLYGKRVLMVTLKLSNYLSTLEQLFIRLERLVVMGSLFSTLSNRIFTMGSWLFSQRVRTVKWFLQNF